MSLEERSENGGFMPASANASVNMRAGQAVLADPSGQVERITRNPTFWRPFRGYWLLATAVILGAGAVAWWATGNAVAGVVAVAALLLGAGVAAKEISVFASMGRGDR